MDDSPKYQFDETNGAHPGDGLPYQDETIWIDGRPITSYDCPDCLVSEIFECDECCFFEPANCPLGQDPFLQDESKILISIYRERKELPYKRRVAIINAIYSEIHDHGLPLHYSVIANMVSKRYPELCVSEKSILMTMTWHPDRFMRIRPGVYKIT